MNKIREFTDLIAWQEAHKLVLLIYKVTKNFPREELYSIDRPNTKSGGFDYQ